MKTTSFRRLVLLLVLSNGISFAQIPTNGLVSWYPFDGNASDASGNGNNGTVTGATLTTDRFGNASKAYSFVANSYISVPHNSAFNASADMTISAWYKTLGSGSPMDYLTIVCKRDDNFGVPTSFWDLTIEVASQKMGFFLYNSVSSFDYQLSQRTVNTSVWQHVVAVIKNNTTYIYLDGVLDSSSPITIPRPSNTNPLLIGWDRDTAPTSESFLGSIDDIRIYSRALSDSEIVTLYQEGGWPIVPPSSPFLVSPANGAINQATNVTLSWNATTGATSYQLQVSASSSFATTVFNQSNLTSTSQAMTGLLNNTTYYWRVSASNVGGTSGWSTGWSFTTAPIAQGVGLSLPTLAATNGAAITVPIGVTEFNHIGAITLTIAFETSLMTYTGLAGAPAGTNATPAVTANLNGRVTITWYGLTPLNIGTDTLLNLFFTYNDPQDVQYKLNGGTTALTFINTIASSITDSLGNNLPATYVNGKVTRIIGVSVSGTVTYGTGSTPISGATVTLTPQNGAATTAQTSSTGAYSFAGVNPGGYAFSVSKTGGHPTTYTNASDALKAALYPIYPSAISTSLAQLAADVNNDGAINAADALLIVLRYVGARTSFAKGDWIFVPAQTGFTAGAANIIINVSAIAVGDVNVDAAPSNGTFFAKSDDARQSVVSTTGATMRINGVDVFEVPVRVKATASIGSMSMAFQYPSESATFLGIRGPEGMVSASNNGVAAIAWFNAESALNLRENDAIVTLRFMPTANVKDFDLCLDPNSQITDEQATVLTGFGIEIPKIDASLPTAFGLGQNYPNPFNPSTTIQYDLPKAAPVSLKIFNALGQEVASLVNGRQEAGSYQIRWNANVPSGIYFYRLQAGEYVETKKAILLK